MSDFIGLERQLLKDTINRFLESQKNQTEIENKMCMGERYLTYLKITKKRKGKEYVAHVDGRGEDGNLQSNLQQQTDDSLFLKKGKHPASFRLCFIVSIAQNFTSDGPE